MRTHSTYLGTAGSIFRRLQESHAPLQIQRRAFGFAAALYQTAVETGLVSLLQHHIPGQRFGTPRRLYFLLPILNRLQHATSKRRMGDWAATTILPDLLGFDPKRFNSKTFWHVTGDVLSGKELQERRQKQSGQEEVERRRNRWGKNLLFTSGPAADSAWIIEPYRSKERIESDFTLFKDTGLIRWRPARGCA